MSVPATLSPQATDVLAEFEHRSRLRGLEVEVRSRSDGDILIIFVGTPTDRLFGVLDEVQKALPADHPFRERVTLRKKGKAPWLLSPEARLLQQVLSESLTVDRHTFEDDFFTRYIRSASGAEDQIATNGNHVVVGRRGSGKSSLLLYAMRLLMREHRPFAWVAMQTYDRRSDYAVIGSVLLEILDQVDIPAADGLLAEDLRSRLDKVVREGDGAKIAEVRQLVPQLKRIFFAITKQAGSCTIFLDDLHVISTTLQPELLSVLYSFARGNRVFLKVSAIEHFARIWDPGPRAGLEVPNDAQLIRLDYNLTNPEKSQAHIEGILNAHALYCGLPSVSVLASRAALLRLVWVAAGVPRDAISIFAQGMVRAVNRSERKISVTSVNVVASQAAHDKMRFVELDSSGQFHDALKVLDSLKDFCIKQEKRNAFLVEIRNDDPTFEAIRKLIDLRLVHVLNPGITPDEAGVRWMVLLLDYGFYTGMKAAKNIDLFQNQEKAPGVRELRKLPRFRANPIP